MEPQRQCRICFGQENEHMMICPCECRGTSAYIHLACLEEYFYHYPNRICRVCHSYMYYFTPFDRYILILLMLWLSILSTVSHTNLLIKLPFMFMIFVISLVKPLRKILNSYISGLIFVCTFILSTTSYRNVTNSIFLIGGLILGITISMYIPLRFILMFFLNILIAVYCIAIVIFFSEKNDVYMTSCFMSVLLFVWAFVIQTRPPPRYL